MKTEFYIKNWTLEEIEEFEVDHFLIVVGRHLFREKHDVFFMKDVAEVKYEKIYKQLQRLLKEGTKSQKERAREAFLNFRIIPFKLQ